MTMQPDIQHELAEAISEIARHHRDFVQISAIVDEVLSKSGLPGSHARMGEALKAIRNIVG